MGVTDIAPFFTKNWGEATFNFNLPKDNANTMANKTINNEEIGK